MVVLDTTRADHLGLYGFEWPTSPFLDRLGSQAVVFRNAYSSSASTAPASASLFTSLYPRDHGVISGFGGHERQAEELRRRGEVVIPINRIPGVARTLPETLKNAGYRTFGLASNINIGSEIGFARGFDRFERHPEASADELERYLFAWRTELHDGDGPFFLYLHLNDAHRPYEAHMPWLQQMNPKGASAVYDSEIRFMDETLARAFERSALLDNALVIVTSDHGEEFFDHGGWAHGPTLYRELNRIVLMIRPVGGVDGPQWVDAPVSIIDVLPTVADMVGIPGDPDWAGSSLVPLFPGAPGAETAAERFDRRSIYAQKGLRDIKDVYAVIRSGWKYIWRPKHYRVLYEVARDPHEEFSQASDQPELAEELHAEIITYRDRAVSMTQESVDVPVNAADFELLRKLGYIEASEPNDP